MKAVAGRFTASAGDVSRLRDVQDLRASINRVAKELADATFWKFPILMRPKRTVVPCMRDGEGTHDAIHSIRSIVSIGRYRR